MDEERTKSRDEIYELFGLKKPEDQGIAKDDFTEKALTGCLVKAILIIIATICVGLLMLLARGLFL